MPVNLFRILPLVFVPLAIALAAPLEIDPQTGQYRDLSYAALNEAGLSAEERTRLFGGETVHYGELTDGERSAAQKQLADLLGMINEALVGRCRTQLDRWLEQQATDLPAAYADRDMHKIKTGAAIFFRAYQIFRREDYLQAGLARADLILKAQWPRGHWPWPGKSANFVRIQDGFNDTPF